MDNGTLFDPEDDNRGTSQGLQIFDNGEFHLEITPVGDSFIVNAPGLARALGSRDATNMLASVPADEKGYFLVSTPGGDQEVRHVTEPGFYRLIGQRQAARIKNPAIKDQVTRFQRWVFHDVLPSIRRTGSYQLPAPQPSTDLINLADVKAIKQVYQAFGAALARIDEQDIQIEREHTGRMIEAAGRQAAEEEIAVLEPKAAQADHHRSADGLMTVGDLANKLKAWSKDECGAKVLHKEVWDFCRELGLLVKSANTVRKNRVTSFAIEQGYLREKDSEHTDGDGNVFTNHTPRVTAKGEGWIWDRATRRLNETGTLRPAKAKAA